MDLIILISIPLVIAIPLCTYLIIAVRRENRREEQATTDDTATA